MNWQDADKADRTDWFNFYGQMVAEARAEFEFAAVRYATLLGECGATERELSGRDIVDQILDAADAMLAEEVRRDLGV